MLVSGIHHVSLNVSDAARSIEFYERVFGFTPLERPNFGFGGAWLDAGAGRQLHLIEATAVPGDVGQHVAFQVADIAAAIEAVRRCGVPVAEAQPIGDTAGLQTFLHDPDGNCLELTQPG